MGCWGMGIAQTDEYCEVYDRFMEEYDQGKPLLDIKKDILEEYLEEFDENDPILHDVYFAIGKAEWICGGISDEILEKISNIINSGENILFYKELEATESDLKLRQKNLIKFLNTLSVPRGKTKKRKIPTEKYVKIEKTSFPPMPNIHDGDVIAYKIGNTHRLFTVVRHQKAYERTVVFCYLWKKEFVEIPELEHLLNEHIMPLGYLNSDTFPKENSFSIIGNMEVLTKIGFVYPPEKISKKWIFPVFILSKPNLPLNEYPLEDCLTVKEVLDIIQK